MKKETVQLIEKTVRELENKLNIIAVYLFGSYAAGRQLPFSDIDICIIGRLNEKEKSEISALGSEKIEISFFDELPIYIKFRVLREGKLLFCRDEEFLHNIAFSTLKEYFSFQPLLRKFERFHLVRT